MKRIIATIAITAAIALAASQPERIPADVQARFEASAADARALDSLARQGDSVAREQHAQAQGMLQGAQRQLVRELRLGPQDTLRPDGTIIRHLSAEMLAPKAH